MSKYMDDVTQKYDAERAARKEVVRKSIPKEWDYFPKGAFSFPPHLSDNSRREAVELGFVDEVAEYDLNQKKWNDSYVERKEAQKRMDLSLKLLDAGCVREAGLVLRGGTPYDEEKTGATNDEITLKDWVEFVLQLITFIGGPLFFAAWYSGLLGASSPSGGFGFTIIVLHGMAVSFLLARAGSYIHQKYLNKKYPAVAKPDRIEWGFCLGCVLFPYVGGLLALGISLSKAKM